MMKKKQTTRGKGTLKAKPARCATPQYQHTSNITILGVGQSLEDERFLKVAVGRQDGAAQRRQSCRSEIRGAEEAHAAWANR